MINPVLKYGRQRDAAALAVAWLTSVRNIHDEIEIGYDADPVDVTWLVQNALDRNTLVATCRRTVRAAWQRAARSVWAARHLVR